MALPPCTIPAESTFVDVGRGVAVIAVEARISGAPCVIDAGSVVRAREEGRAPPELIAFRVELDRRLLSVGGPRARVVAEATHAGLIRFVAVVRGDRFIAAPLATDRSHVRNGTWTTLRTRSTWGTQRIAGVARFIEIGAPIVVTVDPTRDHEPIQRTQKLDGRSAVDVLIVDGGPILGGDVTVATEAERLAALARGGVDALSVLLADLPLAVATAPDDPAAIARLAELSRAARAASLSHEPLVSAIGQRLATAIVRGFATCARGDHALPPQWPAPMRELLATGLLDEPESGCPRIDDLLSTNHPDVRFAQEGSAALAQAAALPTAKLPRIGPPLSEPHRTAPAKTRRWTLVAAIVALVVALGLFVHRTSR